MTARIRRPIPRNAVLVVRKSRYLLCIMVDGECVREYEIALGPNPVGHKEREGDGRTPEGEYRICHKGGVRRTYFMALNYPGPEDAERALQQGRITEEQYHAILDAHLRGECPPFDTPLGGAIGIHEGTEEDWAKGRNWTQGCIGLHLEDAKELFEWVEIGTRVLILP